MADYVSGDVHITLVDANESVINPDQHPTLYPPFVQRDGSSFYLSGDLTSDSPGILQQIAQALAPYQRIVEALASFVSGQPDLASLGNLFNGFRDAVFGAQTSGGEFSKFLMKEITLTIPYPHPSGLRKLRLVSGGGSDFAWVLPDFQPDSQDISRLIPGVKQRVWPLELYWNGISHMDFDLETIAQGPYWKAFFFNDGDDDRFFPIMYWWTSAHDKLALLFVVKLRFVRYNWAPEIKTQVAVSGPWVASSVFVDPNADSVRDGYRPTGASSEINQEQAIRILRWKNGQVSLRYDDVPSTGLSIEAISNSMRLRYPALGSQRNWGVELQVNPPPNLQGLQLPVIQKGSPPDRPNSEGYVILSQRIPGILLMAGSSYFPVQM